MEFFCNGSLFIEWWATIFRNRKQSNLGLRLLYLLTNYNPKSANNLTKNIDPSVGDHRGIPARGKRRTTQRRRRESRDVEMVTASSWRTAEGAVRPRGSIWRNNGQDSLEEHGLWKIFAGQERRLSRLRKTRPTTYDSQGQLYLEVPPASAWVDVALSRRNSDRANKSRMLSHDSV